jgi:uncharacterized membrane protein YoaK (UPF0700 family)
MTESTRVSRDPANQGGTVADVARGLMLAGVFAALAGIVDAIGFLHLKGLFISFMSGNSTQFAAALGQGNSADAVAIAELIAFFVLGAASGQVIAGCAGRWHMALVLVGVTILLAIAAALAGTAEPMVIAMGALNAAMHRAGNIAVSLTFVTGVLVRFGQGLGDFLIRRVTGWNWVGQASPWVGMIIGATIGSVAYTRVGEAAIWLPVSLAGVLAIYSAVVPEADRQ